MSSSLNKKPHRDTSSTMGCALVATLYTMVRRHRAALVLTTAVITWCSCFSARASAIGGSSGTGSAAGASMAMGANAEQLSPAAGDAHKIKEEAMTLHRAGEYEAAAREFSRAADILAEDAVGFGPTPALSAIRLSLAAAQLKSGQLRDAEATCSQLLKTPGLALALRQKASYRRALARQRQAAAAGNGQSGSSLVRKAYRDAYLAVKLSQGKQGAGPAEGDAKAVKLLEEMEDNAWADGRLTHDDRIAARAKADIHLAALASVAAPMPLGNPGGGMFDMLAGGPGGGAAMGGFPGLGGGSAPGLMDMLAGAGGGAGGGGMGELMSMLMGGPVGAGGAGGGVGEGIDKKKMLKTAKKMSKVMKKQLRNPGTQQFVCSFLKKAEPETIKSLANAAGVTVGDEMISRVSTYLKKADGKTLEGWIDVGEIAAGVYKRMSQFAVLWSRGIAIAGLWLIWVWVKACFAPVVLKEAKA